MKNALQWFYYLALLFPVEMCLGSQDAIPEPGRQPKEDAGRALK